jgi:8-oxo-dGTP diphosphatase
LLSFNSFHILGSIDKAKLKYVIIMTKYQNKWILVRSKNSDSWIYPGGRIEKDENLIVAAKRELYEETGIKNAYINPISLYSVKNEDELDYGIIYFAEAQEKARLTEYEIEEIKYIDDMTGIKTRFPEINPFIFNCIKELSLEGYFEKFN